MTTTYTSSAFALSAGLVFAVALPTCGGEPSPAHDPISVVTSVRDASSVAVSDWATCVLHADATVDCWGKGDESSTASDGAAPRRVTRAGARQLSMVGVQPSLLDDSGNIWSWRRGHEESPAVVKGLSDVVFISGPATSLEKNAVFAHLIAIERSGDVFYYCMPGGQCADPPRLVPWAHGASMAAGACAVLSTGTFPSGGYLQCAGPSGEDAHSWFADRTVLSLQGSYFNVYALLDDGSVFCGGGSTGYECGDLLGGESGIRQVPGIPPAVALFVGDGGACAEARDGAVWCWGSGGGLPIDEAKFGTCGYSNYPQPCVAPVAVPALRDAKQVVFAGDHSCAIMGDGSLKCWGDNTFGQLGQ